jgi:hypothetical protein
VCEVCFNVVFSVTVWGTVSLIWTCTESVKADTIPLYSCGEKSVCSVC